MDPRSLSPTQLAAADAFFEAIKGSKLMDVHELAIDPTRARIDDFILSLVATGEAQEKAAATLQTLRNKLAAEPSINGGRVVVGEPTEDASSDAEVSLDNEIEDEADMEA